MPNPFGTTFETFGDLSSKVVDSVHLGAYQRLCDLIDSGECHLISLRTPRAGYGKTMLLSRIRESKRDKVTIIPIHLTDGRRVEGERVLEEVLTQLTELVPGESVLTKLDLHTRGLFAQGLYPLVESEEIPSQDKKSALQNLRDRPAETLDFHNEGATIAEWATSQIDELTPRLSSVLGKASGASGRDVSYWMSLLLDFAVRKPDDPKRTSDLLEAVFGPQSRFRSRSGFLDGLGAFLNLTTLIEPAVLVLDEVDGLSCDADSALQTTSSLVALWQAAPRTSVIISVNDDVWESAFVPKLPLGLLDRLEDVVIRLKPLTPKEAQSLVRIRCGKEAGRVLDHLDLDSDDLYPRGVLKAAREAWERQNDESVAEAIPPPADGKPLVKGTITLSDSKAPLTSVKEEPDTLEEPLEVIPSETNPPVKVLQKTQALYPPHAVKRATLPKSFPVQRIRAPETASPISAPAKVTKKRSEVGVLEKMTPLYPPFPVRRVSLPKSYPVSRIRSTEPVFPNIPAGIANPFEKPGPVDPSLLGPDLTPAAQASPFESN